MAQITSREDLEEWLKDKPASWAQIIASRAALRVLPYAFGEETPQRWISIYSLALFRATAISWAARNFPARDMGTAARAAEVAASAATDAAAYPAATDAADSAAAAAYVTDDAANAASGAGYAADSAAHGSVAWANISHDCNWQTSEGDPALVSRRLTREPLWPAGQPSGWDATWDYAATRLRGLDQGYDVWINWYNSRIQGHDAAFEIGGDIFRTEDKAILARLADATNEDFWDKGAAYVNTTLQSWIDEARERAAIDYVASGVPLNLGSDAELAARPELAARLASVEDALAALKDQLASLTQTGHGGIGHNQPENATSLRDDEIITLNQQVASLETLLTGVQTQLAKPVPDVGQLVQDVPKLNRWGRAMCVMADMSSDKVAEGFEKEIGAAGVRAWLQDW